jgi:hypothetical protein
LIKMDLHVFYYLRAAATLVNTDEAWTSD